MGSGCSNSGLFVFVCARANGLDTHARPMQVTKKNPRNTPDKLTLRKYDPVVRQAQIRTHTHTHTRARARAHTHTRMAAYAAAPV